MNEKINKNLIKKEKKERKKEKRKKINKVNNKEINKQTNHLYPPWCKCSFCFLLTLVLLATWLWFYMPTDDLRHAQNYAGNCAIWKNSTLQHKLHKKGSISTIIGSAVTCDGLIHCAALALIISGYYYILTKLYISVASIEYHFIILIHTPVDPILVKHWPKLYLNHNSIIALESQQYYCFQFTIFKAYKIFSSCQITYSCVKLIIISF